MGPRDLRCLMPSLNKSHTTKAEWGTSKKIVPSGECYSMVEAATQKSALLKLMAFFFSGMHPKF